MIKHSELSMLSRCPHILLIGTSFSLHVEQMLIVLQKNMNETGDVTAHLTAVLSQKVYDELRSTDPNVTYFIFPSRGPLSLTLNVASIRRLRGFRFKLVILLSHDKDYRRNRRAEVLALLCHTNSFQLTSIEGNSVHLSYTELLKKVLFGTYDGSWLDRFVFIAYMLTVRFRALWSVTGRRFLVSRWNRHHPFRKRVT